jgi:hypothetical protein
MDKGLLRCHYNKRLGSVIPSDSSQTRARDQGCTGPASFTLPGFVVLDVSHFPSVALFGFVIAPIPEISVDIAAVVSLSSRRSACLFWIVRVTEHPRRLFSASLSGLRG